MFSISEYSSSTVATSCASSAAMQPEPASAFSDYSSDSESDQETLSDGRQSHQFAEASLYLHNALNIIQAQESRIVELEDFRDELQLSNAGRTSPSAEMNQTLALLKAKDDRIAELEEQLLTSQGTVEILAVRFVDASKSLQTSLSVSERQILELSESALRVEMREDSICDMAEQIDALKRQVLDLMMRLARREEAVADVAVANVRWIQ